MKKFKTKQNHNNCKLVLLFFIILFFIFFIFLSLQTLHHNHIDVVNFLLKNFIKEKRNYSLVKNLNYFVNNYSFENKIEDINNNAKIIYIYNTHENEKYLDDTTVLDASFCLKNNLNKLGIKSIMEDKNVSDYLILGKKDYDISREFIKNVMNNYDVSYFIDIHRDSIPDTKITINNKDYAKILFVLGLDNPNYLENKKVLEKMNNYLNDNYPGLSRGILEKSGESVNGIYNQDLNKNVLLVEVGGVENNKEEVNNSTEIIALMFYNLLGDKM